MAPKKNKGKGAQKWVVLPMIGHDAHPPREWDKTTLVENGAHDPKNKLEQMWWDIYLDVKALNEGRTSRLDPQSPLHVAFIKQVFSSGMYTTFRSMPLP